MEPNSACSDLWTIAIEKYALDLGNKVDTCEVLISCDGQARINITKLVRGHIGEIRISGVIARAS